MALGARQQVKIWTTGQLSRHYIAEISLNVTLKQQPTNQKVDGRSVRYATVISNLRLYQTITDASFVISLLIQYLI